MRLSSTCQTDSVGEANVDGLSVIPTSEEGPSSRNLSHLFEDVLINDLIIVFTGLSSAIGGLGHIDGASDGGRDHSTRRPAH